VLVSVGDQGGGGEHGGAEAGRASEGESSRHQLIRGSQERHGASDAEWRRTVSSTQVLYYGAIEMHGFILGGHSPLRDCSL
jgi:hypothetical protein